jgi:hypothetical protein
MAHRRRRATTLKTDKPLKIGALSVPAGTYGLTIPVNGTWQLIVSSAPAAGASPIPRARISAACR